MAIKWLLIAVEDNDSPNPIETFFAGVFVFFLMLLTSPIGFLLASLQFGKKYGIDRMKHYWTYAFSEGVGNFIFACIGLAIEGWFKLVLCIICMPFQILLFFAKG